MEPSHNIQVLCRIRPASEVELKEGFHSCLEVDKNSIIVKAGAETKTYTYDHVSDPSVSQAEIFEKVGKPITDTCLKGYNGTIFAYGQTGSGKTHTVQGKATKGNERGLMPRVFEYLCESIACIERSTGDTKYTLKGSFLEIYNDHVYDLLTSDSMALNLREDPKRGVFVDGLTEETITGPTDAVKLLERGQASRRVAETAMNRESSRSHCVFSLSITSKKTSADGLTTERFARFNLIDLAGSERQKMTNTSGLRLKEASRINASLSALGNVIMALVDIARSGKKRHVHYRDSKLTFLLQDSLGGNSLTYIVGCLSPAEVNFAETVSTLKFVQRAKFIKNNAKVNEDQSGGMGVLKKECESLKQRIRELESMQSANSRRMTMGYRAPSLMPGAKGAVGVLPQQLLPEELADGKTGPASLLLDSLKREKMWQAEIMQLKARLAKATEVLQVYEKQQQSNAMILKMRDRTIQQYSQQMKSKLPVKSESPLLNEQIKGLKEEISELRKQLANNPAVARSNAQIQVLKDRLQSVIAQQKQDGSWRVESEKALVLTSELTELRKEHAIIMRQNEELQQKLSSPHELLAQMSTPEKRKFESFELQKWKEEQDHARQLKEANEEREAALAEASKLETENKRLEALVQEALMLIEEQKTSSEAADLKHEREKLDMAEDFKVREQENKDILARQLKRMEEGIQQSESANHKALMGLAQTQADLESSECARKKLSQEVKMLRKELDVLQAQFQEVGKLHETTAKQLLSSEQLVEELKSSLVDRDLKLNTTSQDLQSSTSSRELLESELAQVKDAAEKEAQRLETLEKDCSRLNSELQEKTEELKISIAANDKLSFNYEMLQEDQESLLEDQQVKDVRLVELKKAVAQSEAQLKAAKDQVEQLESAVAEKTEQLAMKDGQVMALMNESSHFKSLKDTLDNLKKENAELSGEVKVLSQRNKEEKKRTQEQSSRASKAENCSTKLQENLSSVSEAYQTLRLRFEQQQAHTNAQEAELTACQAQCKEHLKDLDDISAARADAEARLRDLLELSEQTEARFFRETEFLKGELKSTSGLLSAEKRNHANATAELSKLREATDTLVADLSGKLSEIGAKVEKAEEEVMIREAEVKTLTAQLNAAQKEIDEGVIKRKKLEAVLADKEEVTKKLAHEKEQLETQVRRLQAIFAEASAAADLTTDHGGGLDDTEGKDAQDIKGKVTELRTQLLKSQQALEALKLSETAALLAEKNVKATFETMLDKYRAELEHAENQVQLKEATLFEAESRIAELHDMQNKLKGEIAALEKNNEKWENLCSERQVQVENLKAKLTEADAIVVLYNELKTTLQSKEAAFDAIKTDLEQRLRSTDELMQQHASDADAQTFEAARLNTQVESLRAQLQASIEAQKGWLDEIERYRAEEEKTFQANQDLKKQMEALESRLADMNSLEAEAVQLRADVAKLTGHQNARQKIQHHMKIKKENDFLKLKIGSLERELWRHRKTIEAPAFDKENKQESEFFETQSTLMRNQEILHNYLSQLEGGLGKLAGSEVSMDEQQPLQSHQEGETAKPEAGETNKGSIAAKYMFEASQKWLEALVSKTKREEERVENLERLLEQRDRQVRLLQKQAGLMREEEILKDAMEFTEI